MSTIKTCQARQYSDQMECHRCDFIWDINDPEPPQCSPKKREEIRERELRKIRNMLKRT